MDIREKLKLLLGLKKLPEGEELEGFTDEQLAEARAKAESVFTAAHDEKDVETAEEALAIARAIKTEVTERETKAAEVEARLAEMRSEFEEPEPVAETPEEPAAEVTEETPAAEVTDPAEVPATEAPAETPVVEAPVQVAADAGADALKAKLLAAAARPITPKPSALPTTSASPVRIVASGDVADFSPGMTLSMEDMGRAYVEKAKAVSGNRRGGSVKSKVAKLYLEGIPGEQVFDRSDSPEITTSRLNEMVASARETTMKNLRNIVAAGKDRDQVMELTAAGGFCRPFPINYDICMQGDDVRPLRDSLVSVNLPRGGTQYFTSPRLAAVDGSVNVYTEEQDASGYDYPKGCIRVECPETVDAVVQAITLCMEVGNFQRLAWPEIFQTWWQFGKILHARTAEVELWDAMVAGSTARTANSYGLGAFRNTIVELERYVQQYRYEFRLAANAPLRLWVPYWAVSQLRADLTNQMPGDNTVALSDAQLFQYLASLNIAVTPVLDGQDPGTGDDPLPTEAVFILAQEGTWVFGEMGELDFGTEIRDWDQIRQNDSGAFWETFETVFPVCWGSQAITFPLCPSGTTVAAIDSPIECAS